MNAAITGIDVAAELTTGELAEQAAEAVRALNHLTRRESGTLAYPGEVCEIVTALARAASRLPQLLGQLSGWLHAEQRHGRLRVDALSPQPDPAMAVADVIGELTRASQCAHAAGRALDAAHQQLAHLAASGDDSDEPELS
jgi:hypothetical protein